MMTPFKLLTTLLLTGAALLSFAACNLISTPPLGETEPPDANTAAEPPPPTAMLAPTTAPTSTSPSGGATSSPMSSSPAVSSPATSSPAAPGGAPTPAVVVHGGRSIKQWATPPPVTIDTSAHYTAVLNTTAGPITVELLTDDAPNTVNNFVFLAREGFYDNVIFHRTIPGFMIQGGDPTGSGGGGPGYRFADEPVRRPYARGIMAMANAGPNTNGSQFFLMHADYGLPPNYTIFGQTVAGLETIDAIATAPTQQGGEGSRPVNPVIIQSVEIIGP